MSNLGDVDSIGKDLQNEWFGPIYEKNKEEDEKIKKLTKKLNESYKAFEKALNQYQNCSENYLDSKTSHRSHNVHVKNWEDGDDQYYIRNAKNIGVAFVYDEAQDNEYGYLYKKMNKKARPIKEINIKTIDDTSGNIDSWEKCISLAAQHGSNYVGLQYEPSSNFIYDDYFNKGVGCGAELLDNEKSKVKKCLIFKDKTDKKIDKFIVYPSPGASGELYEEDTIDKIKSLKNTLKKLETARNNNKRIVNIAQGNWDEEDRKNLGPSPSVIHKGHVLTQNGLENITKKISDAEIKIQLLKARGGRLPTGFDFGVIPDFYFKTIQSWTITPDNKCGTAAMFPDDECANTWAGYCNTGTLLQSINDYTTQWLGSKENKADQSVKLKLYRNGALRFLGEQFNIAAMDADIKNPKNEIISWFSSKKKKNLRNGILKQLNIEQNIVLPGISGVSPACVDISSNISIMPNISNIAPENTLEHLFTKCDPIYGPGVTYWEFRKGLGANASVFSYDFTKPFWETGKEGEEKKYYLPGNPSGVSDPVWVGKRITVGTDCSGTTPAAEDIGLGGFGKILTGAVGALSPLAKALQKTVQEAAAISSNLAEKRRTTEIRNSINATSAFTWFNKADSLDQGLPIMGSVGNEKNPLFGKLKACADPDSPNAAHERIDFKYQCGVGARGRPIGQPNTLSFDCSKIENKHFKKCIDKEIFLEITTHGVLQIVERTKGKNLPDNEFIVCQDANHQENIPGALRNYIKMRSKDVIKYNKKLYADRIWCDASDSRCPDDSSKKQSLSDKTAFFNYGTLRAPPKDADIDELANPYALYSEDGIYQLSITVNDDSATLDFKKIVPVFNKEEEEDMKNLYGGHFNYANIYRIPKSYYSENKGKIGYYDRGEWSVSKTKDVDPSMCQVPRDPNNWQAQIDKSPPWVANSLRTYTTNPPDIDSCSDGSGNGITALEWHNLEYGLNKSGAPISMEAGSSCRLKEVSKTFYKNLNEKWNALNTAMDALERALVDRAKYDGKLQHNYDTNIKVLKDKVTRYSKVMTELSNPKQDLSTLEAQAETTELKLLSNNYWYFTWTIVAILAILIAIKLSRR